MPDTNGVDRAVDDQASPLPTNVVELNTRRSRYQRAAIAAPRTRLDVIQALIDAHRRGERDRRAVLEAAADPPRPLPANVIAFRPRSVVPDPITTADTVAAAAADLLDQLRDARARWRGDTSAPGRGR